MKLTKRNRNVEIYFILYLAALIFLLPDSGKDVEKSGSDMGIPVFQQPFSLIPEKTSLTCLLARDSSGVKIISIDSINTIYYSGEVQDIKFEMIIEDQTSKQSISLASDKLSEIDNFRLEEREDQHSAVFYWKPPLHNDLNKTYLVRVIVTGTLKNPQYSDNQQITDNRKFKLNTQFSLNIIYLNSGPLELAQKSDSITNTTQPLGIPNNFINNTIFPETFSLFPENNDLRAIAYQKWTNNVYANNINFIRDIKKPEVIINLDPDDNGGTASILAIQENKISIQGKTPSVGRMKVGLKVIRKYDDREFIAYFNVSPQLIQAPDYDRYMYPDQVYTISPNLPVLGNETTAFIKDGSFVRARSIQGEKFQFKPDISDTGKTLTLEMYIDNSLYGQKHYIRVLNHPNPEFIEVINRKKGEIEVITNAFGIVNNVKNEVVDFVIDGNAKFEEKRGGYKNYTNPIRTVQHFIFTPANNSKSFNFRIIAIDKRGKRSEPKFFKES